MLLRESSQAIAQDVELNSTIGGEGAELIPAGQELIDFAEAVTTGGNNLDSARENLRAKLSSEAFIEAAGIAAIFNGLVRTADSSGIPLDDSTKTSSESFRKDLGLNEFPGAANTLRLKKPNGGNLVQQKK